MICDQRGGERGTCGITEAAALGMMMNSNNDNLYYAAFELKVSITGKKERSTQLSGMVNKNDKHTLVRCCYLSSTLHYSLTSIDSDNFCDLTTLVGSQQFLCDVIWNQKSTPIFKVVHNQRNKSSLQLHSNALLHSRHPSPRIIIHIILQPTSTTAAV